MHQLGQFFMGLIRGDLKLVYRIRVHKQRCYLKYYVENCSSVQNIHLSGSTTEHDRDYLCYILEQVDTHVPKGDTLHGDYSDDILY